MMEMAQKLAFEGNCVLTPTYPVLKDITISDEQIKYLKDEHFKRIELSNAIFVIDIKNYIGDSTNLEIEYAKKLEKEKIYYSNMVK